MLAEEEIKQELLDAEEALKKASYSSIDYWQGYCAALKIILNIGED